jgi:hypothetical protein
MEEDMKHIIGFFVLYILTAIGCVPPDPPVIPVILAEFHAWHGLPLHSYKPYDSRDPAVIARQIEKAKSKGISGFVVNWYGGKSNVANDEEREFQDQATAELIRQAEEKDFKIALMYDEGTVSSAESQTGNYTARVQTDLYYAREYLSSPAYLNINDKPALFVFPYDNVDKYVGWAEVRQFLGTPVTLLDKDPNPVVPTDHDSCFDGFFAWVTATDGNWDAEGQEWGEAYLKWFYPTMKSGIYADKVTVGGVWPGFDDTLAGWGSNRYMGRLNTETYDKTMALARQYESPYIMIGTWNDLEEGTDIEYGVEMILDMEDTSTAVLIRSSPLKVVWNPEHIDPVLQVYKEGNVSPIEINSSGNFIALKSGCEYELKLWARDLPGPINAISRWVVIRHQDVIPSVTPVIVDQ